ncbi:bifunctional proline dehydrogenase/L-glutamate gamma-semialdehyde dehydrogenase [Candidatus Poriferisodalis sp.]|uniref:bifunctional proline dehydrogenase/L-glutamate gamma-semialdehyde dehydrogenase n=1 Tax=Candidatus Poriferisodalis sp. TaxID=3101277 RepID=UPI003D0B617E
MASDTGLLVDAAIERVVRWLEAADRSIPKRERAGAKRLAGLVTDESATAFAMRFVDRVVRPENPAVAADQLGSLVNEAPLPAFLSPLDRTLLRAGARLGRWLPRLVMPIALHRMRSLVGHLVVDAEPDRLASHLRARTLEGFALNVNMLGETVLGDVEAKRRHREVLDTLTLPDVNYVSVKVSSIVSQLNVWDFDGSLMRVSEALRPLLRAAATTQPATFVNLDMEEYCDLELTATVFRTLLDEPEYADLDVGIALQAYLPDSFETLRNIVEWHNRKAAAGQRRGTIKIRLVKGANLAMERVEAAIHGWVQAPYATKAETDANYKRCLDWVLAEDRTASVRLGVASHNLFDVAWADLLAGQRDVRHRVEFEMLEGMAPAQAALLRRERRSVLLYTPAVAERDFDVAISYLFRRLEENASDENFIHHLFGLRPRSAAFESEARKFRTAVAQRWAVGSSPRRHQNRRRGPQAVQSGIGFFNEADTDPALADNRVWAQDLLRQALSNDGSDPIATVTRELATVDSVVNAAASAQQEWAATPASERREFLWQAAAELSRRRGDLVAAMIREGHKTMAEADPEVSEAIDFARWYSECGRGLTEYRHARFQPFGTVLVVPPWNFPVAIPAGGVFAALAAGNASILKPAPETPGCAELLAQCCWTAGLPPGLVGFIRTLDDEVGRHLVSHPGVDAVILTGAHDTARMFQSWKPDHRLFAETSGKNAMVITPNADIDLAVGDLVSSAFGHAGQKCSAASLAICVGDAYTSPRLRRQLADAVRSIAVGDATNIATTVGPLIRPPEPRLLRALTQLDSGEEWLVEPRQISDRSWTPGVRIGVRADSWFASTECFGPVLGLMRAESLDHAIHMQNSSPFGLTGGIHTLDPEEIRRWTDAVEVGNAYVNRATTGAIVRRQPFGGWKQSSIGPGAKTGGPNYVSQLGTWHPVDAGLGDDEWLTTARASDEKAWQAEFVAEHDPSGLFCESNIFRYRPLASLALRVEADAAPRDVERVRIAASRCGVRLVESHAPSESSAEFAARLSSLGVERMRLVGTCSTDIKAAANDAGVHICGDPVTAEGRLELVHYLREQAVSQATHRYGNVFLAGP